LYPSFYIQYEAEVLYKIFGRRGNLEGENGYKRKYLAII
jgi:hypothetical protein